MMRIDYVSGTDAIALIGAIDWGIGARQVDISKLVSLNFGNPGTHDIFVFLMFISVILMILSIWLESALQHQIANSAQRPAPQSWLEYARVVVGRSITYLVAYTPAVFFVLCHWYVLRPAT
jgi:hypothetical protein